MRELHCLVSMVRDLKSAVCYAYINGVSAFDKRYSELEDVCGQKIIDVLRYGGYIHIQLSQDAILVDLSEEGSFVLTDELEYDGAIIMLATDHGNLFVVDSTEATGIIPVWKDSTTMPPVGYDPLTKQFNFNLFCLMLENNKCSIETLLKNQLIISGIGDSYSDLILKKANMAKTTKTSSIDKTTARELFLIIKQVLHESVGNAKEEEIASANS